MRILAIDPGFERLGVAVIDKDKTTKETLIYSECFKTDAKLPFTKRLLLIGNKIETLIKEYKPECLAIETLFMATNKKTGMRVAEARGAIIYKCVEKKLSVYEYSPLQIKVAVTGYGKSDKTAVMDMVSRIIKIPKKSSSDDELDAIAIGITCIAYEKF